MQGKVCDYRLRLRCFMLLIIILLLPCKERKSPALVILYALLTEVKCHSVGLALPAIHSMIQKYVGATERVTSAAVVTAACYLGALLSNLLSPMIISQSGWEACFFYFAAIPPLIWLPLWAVFLSRQKKDLGSGIIDDKYEQVNLLQDGDHDSANKEKEVLLTEILTTHSVQCGDKQPAGIEPGHILGADDSEINIAAPEKIIDRVTVDDGKLPLSTLLRSPSVWAIIAAQYGQSWGMIGLLSWLPTYFTQRFHVPLESLSSYTVLPYFLQMVVGISAGFCADRLVIAGVRILLVRQVFQIAGMLVPAACLAYCACTPSLEANQAAAAITLGSAVSAITVAAVSANHFDISPKNAGTIFGIGNTAGCIG